MNSLSFLGQTQLSVPFDFFSTLSLLSFNFVIIGKSDILTLWNSHKIRTGGFNTTDGLESTAY